MHRPQHSATIHAYGRPPLHGRHIKQTRTNSIALAVAREPIAASNDASLRRSTAAQTLSWLRSAQLLLSVCAPSTPHTAARAPSATAAVWGVNTAVSGGVCAVSVSLQTSDALLVLRELRLEHPTLLHAAGETLSTFQQSRAETACAHLTLSPVADAELVRVSISLGVPHIPGAATPSEALAMRAAGARVVKLFPARELGGASFAGALARVLPAVHVMSTSGVTLEDLPIYMSLRTVIAVGVSSQILSPEIVDIQDARALRRRAQLWVTSAAAAVAIGAPRNTPRIAPAALGCTAPATPLD